MNPALIFIGCIIVLVLAGGLGVKTWRKWDEQKSRKLVSNLKAMSARRRAQEPTDVWEAWNSEKSDG
jgi:hypothetical protein